MISLNGGTEEKSYSVTGRRNLRERRSLQSCGGYVFIGDSPCDCEIGDVPADVTNDCQATPADAQVTAYYMASGKLNLSIIRG